MSSAQSYCEKCQPILIEPHNTLTLLRVYTFYLTSENQTLIIFDLSPPSNAATMYARAWCAWKYGACKVQFNYMISRTEYYWKIANAPASKINASRSLRFERTAWSKVSDLIRKQPTRTANTSWLSLYEVVVYVCELVFLSKHRKKPGSLKSLGQQINMMYRRTCHSPLKYKCVTKTSDLKKVNIKGEVLTM